MLILFRFTQSITKRYNLVKQKSRSKHAKRATHAAAIYYLHGYRQASKTLFAAVIIVCGTSSLFLKLCLQTVRAFIMLLIRSLLAFAFLVPGLQKRLRQVSKTAYTPIQFIPASWCPYLSHTWVRNAVNSLRASFKLLISYLLEHTHSSWEGTAKPPKTKHPLGNKRVFCLFSSVSVAAENFIPDFELLAANGLKWVDIPHSDAVGWGE